jgi:hypothetical protein
VQLSDQFGGLGRSSEHAEVAIAARTRKELDIGGNGVSVLEKSPTPRITIDIARGKVKERERGGVGADSLRFGKQLPGERPRETAET